MRLPCDSLVTAINFTGATIGNLGYTWDVNHNKTSETIAGTMSGYGFTAGYDADDRLTSWQRASTTLDQSWNLSPVGNWNSFTENASTQVRTHSPANEILTAASQAVQHDPKGNATLLPLSLRPAGATPLPMKWDFDNRLLAADSDNSGTDDVFYLWDALGRRVARTAGGATTVYFQDGQQTLAEYASGAPANSPTHNYIWGSYIDELVLRTSSSGNHYFHRNQQYSIIAATTSAGAIAERYAYGDLTILNAAGTPFSASAINNRYTYTGREWDAALALYHYRARMYSPLAGRFLARDPIGYQDGASLYRSYFTIQSTDPTGLEERRVEHGFTLLGYYYRKTTVFGEWQRLTKQISFPGHQGICRCGDHAREIAVNVGFELSVELGFLGNVLLEALEFSLGISAGASVSHTMNMNCEDWSKCKGNRAIVRRPRATVDFEHRSNRHNWEYQTDVWGWDYGSIVPVWRKIGFQWNQWKRRSSSQIRNATITWDDYVVSDTGTCCCD